MNKEPVSREEFEALRGELDSMNKVADTQQETIGYLNKTNDRILTMLERAGQRLEAAERLLDGVRDAVLCVASDTDLALVGGKMSRTTRDIYTKAVRVIVAAQQPPATATGEPVVIVATESAGPSIARILARTSGVNATDANTSVGIDPAASAAATTNERATERREAQQMECDGCRSRVNLATYALTRDGGSFGNYRYCPSCADVDRRKGYSLELVPDGSQTELERVRKIMS